MLYTIIQILLLIISYLIGSIPFAKIISRLVKNIDISQYGSKNIGATNVFRVIGFKWGLLTFVLDAMKSALLVLLAKLIIYKDLFNLPLEDFPIIINPLLYGLFAFLGHLFPIYLRFKGGKGVSCAAGVILAYNPLLFLVCFVSFITIVTITRYISVGSCTSFIICTIVSIFLNHQTFDFLYILFFSTLSIILHIPNIKRLLNKEESRVNFKAFVDKSEPAFIKPEKKGITK